ncbi:MULTISPECIES: LysR family transcriptional regulator [Chromobacterium]|uniref:LysR family transcriptional regulator n=1 Tax=Chromobacterium TaxID=535 RepID=UPI0005BC8BE1|nr:MULTISPECIES: LysR family transcriptional regulator [Chromobacterium]QOZ82861.1 LysR family transcriptional regulator [Chromobacterium sp. Rain0013]WON82931.1 LysR family transcriptional regulator [Chromobacterium haemolyticum]
MDISLRHIEVFRAVMTTGSVTEAAVLLRTSQPTVSRELARCEQLLGMALFERSRGRLRPSAQGLLLFEEVQRSYQGLERIVSSAAAIRQFEQGQLSIVCLPVFAQSLLPAVCRRFLSQAPGISLNIAPQESPLLEEWLAAQRHDLGLSESAHAPAGTRVEPLLQADELCVLPEGHRLLSKTVLAPEDFEGEAFISLAATDSYRQQLDQVFSERGVKRRMVVETHSAASVCAMARQGIGVAVVNPLTALDYAGAGLAMRRFSVSIPFAVNLVRPLHRPVSPLLERFVDSLKAELGVISQRLAAPAGV